MASLPSQPMPRGLGAPLILIVTACRAPEPSHCGKAARDKAAAAERVAVESSNAGRTEQRGYEAEIHRIRAEILLKRDPASTAAAEQSLQAAIAIAQSQKARSFELRAALSLAKLYHAADRDADAHAVLAPAVEGFPPTRQFPELTDAQSLLAVLSESHAVKSAAALRQRRLHLQTSLGNALIHAKGQQAPETSAAYARARELASQVEDPAGWGICPAANPRRRAKWPSFFCVKPRPGRIVPKLWSRTAFPAPPAFFSATLPTPISILGRPLNSTIRHATAI